MLMSLTWDHEIHITEAMGRIPKYLERFGNWTSMAPFDWGAWVLLNMEDSRNIYRDRQTYPIVTDGRLQTSN